VFYSAYLNSCVGKHALGMYHRVDRVLGFSPFGLPQPLTLRRVCFPLLWMGGGVGYTFACGRGGGRVPVPTRGQTLWYSWYICTLSYVYSYIHLNVSDGVVTQYVNIDHLMMSRVVRLANPLFTTVLIKFNRINPGLHKSNYLLKYVSQNCHKKVYRCSVTI
jgi:hypothetical protein